ncbi:CoA transferase [uncultured Oscillibacter sp.]|uniref:CaiB/BaiF CoA transferase family protein n=1 Tax=uncultured Oscillibacter sp. TaxID=876091 RepID=UPI0028044047|nr:CoA transferase [uncultured Oscillibacter sp.]
MKPLEGYTVLDLSHYLAGPSAALRLADLGATVIKVERPGTGEPYRRAPLNDLKIDGENYLFHIVNRNKDSIAIDLKHPQERKKLDALIATADVVLINFRPAVTKKLELDYEHIRRINPSIIYAEITGYGKDNDWENLPGQDLLVQSMAGIGYLNGNSDQPPMVFGLSLADQFAGQHLVQGILAALYRRARTGKGAQVEVSLMETIMDVQFEAFTTYLNDGLHLPERCAVNNANVCQGAPYGIYETKDRYLALAMGSILRLGELLECDALSAYTDPNEWFTKRDEIKQILCGHLKTRTTREWLDRLEPADIWCADVLNWEELMHCDGFAALDMLQEIPLASGGSFTTTRCPITIDGNRFTSEKPAPSVGKDNGTYCI